MRKTRTGQHPGRKGQRQQAETLPGLESYDEARDEAKREAEQRHEIEGQLASLTAGLWSDEPLEFLAPVSGMVALLDPRTAGPDDLPEPSRPSIHEVVDGLLGFRTAETSAVLTAIQALVPDQLLDARIARELAGRGDRLPDWVTGLSEARVEPDQWVLSDALGDCDVYVLGVTLPAGHPLTAVVYVDNNLGSRVEDAVVIPAPVAQAVEELTAELESPDESLEPADAATVRAILEEAIDVSARTDPTRDTDSWPGSRPLIELMLRRLPPGGVAPARPRWSDGDLAALTDDVLASPYGAPT